MAFLRKITGGFIMSDISLKKLYRSSSLRTKVNLIFFVLLIIPLALFTFYATGRMRDVMKEQTFTVAQKSFNETVSTLNSLTVEMYNVSNIIANNANTSSVISVEEERNNVFLTYSRYLDFSSLVSNLKSLSGIFDITVYSDSRFFTMPLSSVRQTEWFSALSTYPSKQWFAPDDISDNSAGKEPFFSYMRLLHSKGNFLTYDGVLQVNVPENKFREPLLKTTVTPNSTMFLLTEDQILLTSNTSSPEFNPSSLSKIVSGPSDEWRELSLQGGDYYLICEKLALAGWTLATVIPKSDVASVSNSLSLQMLGLMLILACVAYFIAVAMADSILKRVSLLTSATGQLESGNTDINLSSVEQDELGILMARFDHMADRIDQLMDEKVQYGKQIQNLELKALQAQINPHFLYNTLDTINCLAIQKGATQITELVNSLAVFYRISLSKGRESITIREEVTHSQMYLNILDSRFPNQIRVEWDISQELMDLNVIKIILQPVIENAAIHGIYERPDGKGTLVIRGWLEGENVYITVADDGVGMTQDTIDANFGKSFNQEPGSRGGYGIRNICDRIHAAYGTEYGLSCVSEIGKGTTVTIHIPKIKS